MKRKKKKKMREEGEKGWERKRKRKTWMELGEMKQRSTLKGWGRGERRNEREGERERHTTRGRSTPPFSNLALWIRLLLSYPVPIYYHISPFFVQSQKLTTVNFCSLIVILMMFLSSFPRLFQPPFFPNYITCPDAER